MLILFSATVAYPALPIAQAATEQYTKTEIHKVREELRSIGIPSHIQDELIEKLIAGDEWDALNAEKEPVKTETQQIDNSLEIRAIYEDGSVILTRMEGSGSTANAITSPTESAATNNETLIQPMAISSCRETRSGSKVTRRNCTISASTALTKASFTADYEYTYKVSSSGEPNIGSARILKAFAPSVSVIGGSVQSQSLKIHRSTAAYGVPAHARLAANGVIIKGVASRTIELNLYVPMGDTTLAYTRYRT